MGQMAGFQVTSFSSHSTSFHTLRHRGLPWVATTHKCRSGSAQTKERRINKKRWFLRRYTVIGRRGGTACPLPAASHHGGLVHEAGEARQQPPGPDPGGGVEGRGAGRSGSLPLRGADAAARLQVAVQREPQHLQPAAGVGLQRPLHRGQAGAGLGGGDSVAWRLCARVLNLPRSCHKSARTGVATSTAEG